VDSISGILASAKGHQTEPNRSEAKRAQRREDIAAGAVSIFCHLGARFARARERASERPISSGRSAALPRVCRFIASRPIRDNCCWSGISDVRAASRDAKPFFRARARAHGAVRTRRCFITCEIFLQSFRVCAQQRTHIRTRMHARSIIARLRTLERASFIAAAVNARANRRAGGTRLIGMLLARLKY